MVNCLKPTRSKLLQIGQTRHQSTPLYLYIIKLVCDSVVTENILFHRFQDVIATLFTGCLFSQWDAQWAPRCPYSCKYRHRDAYIYVNTNLAKTAATMLHLYRNWGYTSWTVHLEPTLTHLSANHRVVVLVAVTLRRQWLQKFILVLGANCISNLSPNIPYNWQPTEHLWGSHYR